MGLDGSRTRLREAAGAFTRNWRNLNLRRAQLRFLGAWTAEWRDRVGRTFAAVGLGLPYMLGLKQPRREWSASEVDTVS